MLTDRYWIYKEKFLQGPFAAPELAQMKDFSASLLVCQDGDDHWCRVCECSAFKDFLPQRVVSTGDYRVPSAAEKAFIQ